MAMVQSLLVRSLVAWFWDEPLRAPLIRHGANLHGRYLLPHFLIHDIADVAADLRAHGINFDTSWLDPFTEFRFPRIGTAVFDGVEIELRGAIEPWNILGEESTAGGTARYVDSSVERIQVRLIGADRHRYVVTANGYPVPLLATDIPDVQVGGVRFRAWQPPSALHPTITVDGPLRFELVDTATGDVARRLHLPRVASRAAVPTTTRPSTPWRPSRGGAAASRRPASHRARSTCPTSARSRRASPPTSARRASSICAECVPFCSNGSSRKRRTAATSRRECARPRQPAGRVPHRAGPGGAVRRARRCGHRLRRIRRRRRQCPAGLAGAGRMRRRAWPRRPGPAARGGAQPGRQRRHHLHPGRPARRRGHQRRRDGGARAVAPRRAAAADLGVGLGHAGIRSGATVPAARRRAHRPVRAAPLGDQRGAARRSCCSPTPATSGPPAASRCPAGTSCSCTAATSAERADGSFRVNADWTQAPSGAGYALADRRVVAHAIPDLYERIGPRPASPWAQALRLALIDAAPEVGRGTRGGGAQPRHPLRDRVRPGLPGQRARLPAGGKRRPGGARRQAVDAVDGHAEAGRRGAAPGGRRLTPTRWTCAPTPGSAWSGWSRCCAAAR